MNPLDPSRGDAENARDELYGKYHQVERLETELNRLTQHAANVQAVKSVLLTELSLVIHTVREFKKSLLKWMIPVNQEAWPEAFGEAWVDLNEVIRSAAKCLQ